MHELFTKSHKYGPKDFKKLQVCVKGFLYEKLHKGYILSLKRGTKFNKALALGGIFFKYSFVLALK